MAEMKAISCTQLCRI